MKIAVYTIALNEEQFVETWYNSAKNADYLLIADTGSTDGTIEKARELGITVVPIAIKPWRFDDARNASLALLPADIDMCICLDMDEVLVEGWRELLETTTAPQISYKYTWSWKDASEKVPGFVYAGNKVHARFGYRWTDLIHEVLLPEQRFLEEHYEEYLEGFEIHHHPDQSKSRSSYIDLLKVALAENSNNPRLTLYHARELGARGLVSEAKSEFKRFLKIANPHNINERSLAYRHLAQIDPKNRESYLLKAAEITPTRREPLVSLAVYYFKQENWAHALMYCNKALDITFKTLDYTMGEYAWGYLPLNMKLASENNMKLDKKSTTYDEDKWKLNVDSIIATDFDLYGQVDKKEEEQVLFEPDM